MYARNKVEHFKMAAEFILISRVFEYRARLWLLHKHTLQIVHLTYFRHLCNVSGVNKQAPAPNPGINRKLKTHTIETKFYAIIMQLLLWKED